METLDLLCPVLFCWAVVASAYATTLHQRSKILMKMAVHGALITNAVLDSMGPEELAAQVERYVQRQVGE